MRNREESNGETRQVSYFGANYFNRVSLTNSFDDLFLSTCNTCIRLECIMLILCYQQYLTLFLPEAYWKLTGLLDLNLYFFLLCVKRVQNPKIL